MGFNAEKWLTGNSQFSNKEAKQNKKVNKVVKKEAKRKKEKPTMQERVKRDHIDYGKTVKSDSAKADGNKQYDWKTKNLGPLSIKSYGRSYDAKFDKWSSQQGITDKYEKKEFRKYMDYMEQEEKRREKAKSQKLTKKELADGVKDNSGYSKPRSTPWERDDAILKTMDRTEKARNQQKAKRANDKSYQADKANRKATREATYAKHDEDKKKRETNSRDGALGFLDRTLGRLSDKAVSAVFGKGFADDNNTRMAKNAKIAGNKDAEKMLHTQSRKANGKLEKTADVLGTIIGETAPYMMGAYGAGSKVLKATKVASKLKGVGKIAAEGAAAGAVVGTGKAAIRELTDEKYTAKDSAKRIATETALGAAGDVGANYAIKGLGRLVTKLRGGKTPPVEVIKAHAKATGQKEQDIVKALSDMNTGKSVAVPLKSDDIVKSLASPQKAAKALAGETDDLSITARKLLEDLASKESEHVTKAKANVDKKIALKNDGYDAYRTKDLEPDELSALMAKADELNGGLSKAKQEYFSKNPHYAEVAKKRVDYDNAKETFKVNKELKSQAKAIQQKYGKIIVPENNRADWFSRVPPRFRANSKETGGSDLYAVADDMGYGDVDSFVQHLQNLDGAVKTKAKDLIPAGMETKAARQQHAQELKDLEEMLDAEFTGLGQGGATQQELETILDLIQNPTQRTNAIKQIEEAATAEFRGSDYAKSQDDVLAQLFDNLKPQKGKGDNSLALTASEAAPIKFASKTEETAVKELGLPVQPKDFDDGLLRLNAQHFESDNATNSMYSKNPGELKGAYQDENAFKQTMHKMYEGVVSSKHKMEVVSKKLYKQNKDLIKSDYQAKILEAKAKGMPKEAKRLEKELKYLHKEESPLVKSAENEGAAYLITQSLMDRTLGAVTKPLKKAGISIVDAFDYQTAKSLDFQINQGGHEDYVLPKGWDQGRIIDTINLWNGNEAMGQFSKAINDIRLERLDYLHNSGLKSSDEFAALSANPHYLPLRKDHNFSGAEAEFRGSGPLGSAAPNVKALGKGDEYFFDNPLETLMSATYTTIRNSLRNSTHAEFAKLAKLDTAGKYIRQTKKPVSDNVIEHYENGIVKKYEISSDMAQVLKDMRSVDNNVDMVQKASALMAGLKTTSVSYQMKAIPRDWAQFLANADGNPVTHLANMIKTFSKPAKMQKELMKEGSTFQNAYRDSLGSYEDTSKLAQKFIEVNSGKDKIITGKKAVNLLSKTLENTLGAPFKAGAKIGNFADNAPRYAQLMQVDKEFKPVLQELEQQVANATPATKDVAQRELDEMQRQYQQAKIFKTRDVINYQRTGGSNTAKFIKKYMNFANTATQSVDRFARQVRKKPIATTLKVASLSVPMMAAQEINYQKSSEQDKQYFDDTPDYIKNTMYVFMVNGNRVMLPKPFEVALVTSPIEAYMNQRHKDAVSTKKEAVLDTVMFQLQQVMPLQSGFAVTGKPASFLTPSIIAPAGESARNYKDFTEKPINFKGKEGGFLLPEGKSQDEIASLYATDTSRKLGGDTVNADHLDYLIRSYGGDMGKLGLTASDYAMDRGSSSKKSRMVQSVNPLQDFVAASKDAPSEPSKLDDILSQLFRPAYYDKTKQDRRKKQ